MKPRRTPMRMCAGCRQMRPKDAMLRIVLSQGGVRYDPTGKEDGRGVYVCRDADCIAKMQKARRSRLAGNSAVPDSVFEQLREVAKGE